MLLMIRGHSSGVERLASNQDVVGSIPTVRSNQGGNGLSIWTHRLRQPRNYRELFDAVRERDGMICLWCDVPVEQVPRGFQGALRPDHATLDHLVPQSAGGANDPENLVMSCNECNVRRGARTCRGGPPLTKAEHAKLASSRAARAQA